MNALHVLTAIVMTGCLAAVLTAATQPLYPDKPLCTETDLSCRETQGRVLCVYKYISDVLSPHVFIDYKEASSSQYVQELLVHGRYYNATGNQSCSEDGHRYYHAGVLLIQPQSLPAHVEVSFTKNRPSTTPFFLWCNTDSFPSYNTTVVKQGSCSCSASTCIQHKIKANLARVARLLDTVSELLTQ